uniref:Uncharacterized protein n=1 Tax=Neogobius melanostomus TaxID=47308 RepID=A0A8C6USD6_9GOBI
MLSFYGTAGTYVTMCLFYLEMTLCLFTAQMEGARCIVEPVQRSHPVQGLLERFEAGPGCSARENGPTETHVIAVGRASNSPENKVIAF